MRLASLDSDRNELWNVEEINQSILALAAGFKYLEKQAQKRKRNALESKMINGGQKQKILTFQNKRKMVHILYFVYSKK